MIKSDNQMTLKRLIFATLLIAITFTSCDGQNNNSQESNKKEQSMNFASSDTTGQLMNEDNFWKIIDKARTAANNNYEAEINTLKTILLTLDATEIEKFDNRFTALLAASYDNKLWGASYVINGGCSDDCFDYF